MLLVCLSIVKDHIVAEDITQDVFIILWEKRAELKFDEKLTPYVKKAARNRSLNYLRDAFDFINIETIHSIKQEEYSIENEEKLIRLANQINQLPPQCRKVFQLATLQGLTYDQVATQLGISKNTVKTQMGKAFSTLRKKNQ